MLTVRKWRRMRKIVIKLLGYVGSPGVIRTVYILYEEHAHRAPALELPWRNSALHAATATARATVPARATAVHFRFRAVLVLALVLSSV